MFDYKNGQLVNEKGKVMDVAGHRDRQHNNIGVYRKHHGLNQQFDLIYVDEWKEPPKKGELNEDFGMYVERPFMVRSDLPRGRYLDILGRNMVIKTPNGRNTQMWWFIKDLELSRIGITRDGHLTFKVLENKPTCKLGTLIPAGGNFSDGAMSCQHSSMLRMVRYLMFLEEEMKKLEMFKLGRRMVHLLKNGLLSMLMITKQR
jgi:hypothetical protein